MGPETHWRGQTDTVRRLRWFVLMSALLHAPFTPLVGLLGLLGFLVAQKPPPVPPEPLTTIPVDLLEGDDLGPAAPPPAVAAPPEPAAAEPEAPKPKPKPKPKPPSVDAGVPDAEAPDAAAPDAAIADASADASVSDGGIANADGGAPNPMAALTGEAKKVLDEDANVRLVIYPEKIRHHPLAPRIGQLLGSVYQWRDFFGPSKLDPMRDVDRIMIVGPELRDSTNVAAIIQHNVGASRMHEALDALVQADPDHGAWLDAGVPAATAYADRAPRVLVMPSSNVVLVVPPGLRDVALSLKRPRIPKPTGSEVVWAYAVTPWRPARALGVQLPKSLKWAKVWVTPSENGGAVVEAEAQDESPEAASKHAAELNAQIQDALSTVASFSLLGQMLLGTKAVRLVEHVEITAAGDKLRGSATLTEEQLERIFEQLKSVLAERRLVPSRGREDAGR